jgi:hypothetical protein
MRIRMTVCFQIGRGCWPHSAPWEPRGGVAVLGRALTDPELPVRPCARGSGVKRKAAARLNQVSPRNLSRSENPPVNAMLDWDALAQPQPEYVFDQQVQW